jgi:hypothetical protein
VAFKAVLLALGCATGAAFCVWHWRQCYRRQWIYFGHWVGQRWYRKTDPFNYWFRMAFLASCGAGFSVLAVVSILMAFGVVE